MANTPPIDITAGLSDYLFRQARETEEAILTVNGIAIREELPDRPREGKLYFIRDDGFYYDVGGLWFKLNATAI